MRGLIRRSGFRELYGGALLPPVNGVFDGASRMRRPDLNPQPEGRAADLAAAARTFERERMNGCHLLRLQTAEAGRHGVPCAHGRVRLGKPARAARDRCWAPAPPPLAMIEETEALP